jgi:hypothetical protein
VIEYGATLTPFELRRAPRARSSKNPPLQRGPISTPCTAHGERDQRTTYWARGEAVSLAFVPALADEYPEATGDEPPRPIRLD